jgi:hypothetical protein
LPTLAADLLFASASVASRCAVVRGVGRGDLDVGHDSNTFQFVNVIEPGALLGIRLTKLSRRQVALADE